MQIVRRAHGGLFFRFVRADVEVTCGDYTRHDVAWGWGFRPARRMAGRSIELHLTGMDLTGTFKPRLASGTLEVAIGGEMECTTGSIDWTAART